MRTPIFLLSLAFIATACLLPRELEAEREYQTSGSRPRASPLPRSLVGRAPEDIPIGKGDRFNNGSVTPVGFGSGGSPKSSIFSVTEVSSALRGLQSAYPDDVKLFTPPFKTHERRDIHGAIVGGSSDGPRVFLMSGIHARERGGPDHLLYFVADLLSAKTKGTSLSYGGRNYSSGDVDKILTAGIVMLPLTNPDGVTYDQATSTCWRKNRRPAPRGSSGADSIGVDLNRNFDFVWDYHNAFNPEAQIGSAASDDPASEIYHGQSPASEPEVQAIIWVMDQYQSTLSWFLDLHSFSGTLLYGWGDDEAGTEYPEQNFANKTYDGLRGFTDPDPKHSQYKEYMSAEDLAIEKQTGAAMANAMNAANGKVPYGSRPSVLLYPTCGCSNDYAMSRYYGGTCGANRLYGLCLEFGSYSYADYSCPFYPSAEEYHDSTRQVGAGMMELMLTAAGPAGEPKQRVCEGR